MSMTPIFVTIVFPLLFFFKVADCMCFPYPLSEMGDKAFDWLQDKALDWIQAPQDVKIDTHHPAWPELNRCKALVFVHPTHPVDTTTVNSKLPQPAIDYPHETTRSAMDMILMGYRSKYPDCKVILSHAGGTLPYLISRMTTPMWKVPDFAASYRMGTTHDRLLEDFRSFYFDLALSSSPHVLDMALKMIPHDHILYGSDFPYAPITTYPAFLEDLRGVSDGSGTEG